MNGFIWDNGAMEDRSGSGIPADTAVLIQGQEM